ncbi:MAG: hypothetical protein NTV34_09975, partial [Proteobacteria bacterium]|nr:hypothetical protein [Pseudomonadota bacterium]
MIIKAQSFSAVRCLSIILGFTLLLRMPGLNAQPEGNSKSVQSSAKENNERDPEGEVDPSKLNTPVTLPNDDAPQVFFDARNTGFSKDGSQQIFEGDVIAIGAKSLVTADKVVIDEKRKYLVADGHVIILSNGQYITGDRVELWSDTGDLRVTAAMLVVNDGKEADRIAQEILGYSASEIEFEAHRQSRLSEIGKKKELVSKEARRKTKQGLNVPEEVIKDYARLLEQEDLVQKQENPAFAQMAESRRQTLRRRRDFWEQARLASKVNSPTINAAYFRMYGETLERTNGNDLLARDGVWTPCHCEKDEIPAWAFRSSEIAAQPGGYATFKDAILEIKGVPVLYLPWFRVPIKDKRQSGLLPPGFSSDSKSGTVYSQPLFLDLGPDRDVTLKADLFERRGTKFALEGRYLRKKYSGFQLNVEVMRDRVWLAEKSNREELRELYFGGLDAARLDNSTVDQDISATSGREFAHRVARRRTYWEGTRPECLSPDPKIRIACEDKLRSEIRPPNNSTRGMLRWTGQERITDRLSFVSTGEIYADRQYNSDLYVPESFQAGFDTGSGERAIQPVKLQAHLDRRNYYLGLGSYFGDSVRGNDRYEGYQLPAVMKAKSRWLRIGNTGVPIYASTSLDQYRMARIQGERTDPEAKRDFLPSGWWRRLSASVVAPVSAKTAVQVDYFTDMEARHISFDRTSVKSQDGSPQKVADSTIQSLKTGFRFQLPIDGKRLMPSWLGSSSLLEDEGGRYIQHIMNWSMTLSVRPSVVRKGPYGEAYDVVSSKSPRYFMATDSSGSDESIGAEDFLNE